MSCFGSDDSFSNLYSLFTESKILIQEPRMLFSVPYGVSSAPYEIVFASKASFPCLKKSVLAS
jgi:hypothetical protein